MTAFRSAFAQALALVLLIDHLGRTLLDVWVAPYETYRPQPSPKKGTP